MRPAEIASKNDERIRQYLGEKFRTGNNKSIRHLKGMLREEREYDGGG